jgi:hypothetical protein
MRPSVALATGLSTNEVFKVGRTTNLVIDTGGGEWRPSLAAARSNSASPRRKTSSVTATEAGEDRLVAMLEKGEIQGQKEE